MLPVDRDVAVLAGQLSGGRCRDGVTLGQADVLIAATALHHRMAVLTGNVKHFEPTGVVVVNPWQPT